MDPRSVVGLAAPYGDAGFLFHVHPLLVLRQSCRHLLALDWPDHDALSPLHAMRRYIVLRLVPANLSGQDRSSAMPN
jgi:hypothetical protein